LYVDNGLILARNQETIHKILEALKTEFEVTVSSAAYFWSLEIKRDSNTKTITISLEQYIKRILKKFGMSDPKSISTPVEANKRLKYLPEDQVDISMKEVPYQQAVESLLFAACVSRPDIKFAGQRKQVLNQFNNRHIGKQ